MFKHSATQKIIKSQRGMSLIEILISLALLAVGGTFVVTNLSDRLDEGNIQAAKIQIGSIGKILKDFRRKCGRYPTTAQNLDALITKPTGGKDCRKYPANGFIEGGKIPRDPWDEEYVYESDGRKYTLISYGPDREEGGEGTDADISSEDL